METPTTINCKTRRSISGHNKTPFSFFSPTTITSSLPKEVFLHDWWLIKSDICSNGKQLGIGGFSSRERQGMRVFQSAAIVKRHDTVTLETFDGITVTVSGLINRSRTLQNGFTSEICNRFCFGFPYDWEEFAAVALREESTNGVVPQWTKRLDEAKVPCGDIFNASFEDLPMTAINDLLMSTLGDSEVTNIIFDNISRNYAAGEGESDCLNDNVFSKGKTRDSIPRKNQNQEKTNKADQKRKSDYAVSDANPSKITRSKKEKKNRGYNATSDATPTPTPSRITRSMKEKKNKGDNATSDATPTPSRITRSMKEKMNLGENASSG